jgi:uncharacterized membrane protein YfcA
MQLYLPIAEISVNVLVLLAAGGAVGFLSGMFGVGGGFLMTPLLIFLGVPPAVAVGTQANQLVAASVSGVLAHLRRNNVDVKMAIVMLAGSLIGTSYGVWIFGQLQRLGQIDLTISLAYVVLLGAVGGIMLNESVRTLRRGRVPASSRGKLHHHIWLHRLPLKMRFPRSKLYVSAMLPFGIGALGGLLVAVMGIGGGFLMVPAMIYLLGMPTALVAGTSLFQIVFTTAATTVMQAAGNHTVDIMLAALLIAGGVIGAQFGTRAGAHLRGEQARALLGLLVVAVAARLAWDLVLPPADVYSVVLGGRP